MSDYQDGSAIKFKSWQEVKREVLHAIREIAQEPLARDVFPTSIHIEGYPGPGITTSTFRAQWAVPERLTYRVRVYLDRNSTNRAEVL